jgi:GNAT superfamily N-acetyltransferase
LADAEILAIERAAFAAWPAAEVLPLGGWRLRFDHGVTQRGSSVWPGPGESELPLAARIEAAERCYAERGAKASFQLSPVADPRELDAALAARGYETPAAPVSVEIAALEPLAANHAFHGVEAVCTHELSEEWFDLSGRQGRFHGADVEVYRALLDRLSGRAGFALARVDGQAAAVGLAVVAPPWAGVFSMLTLPAQRGRRLGEAVLGAIARWVQARAASQLYLQVESDNAPARRLYARAGFVPRYAYHYRRQAQAR